MKKIVFLMSLVLFFAVSSFASDGVGLSTVLQDTTLSNGVEGFYSSTATEYILQTGHDQGDRVFGSGSFSTTISYSKTSDPATTQLISGSTFDSSEFDSGATWTPIGE